MVLSVVYFAVHPAGHHGKRCWCFTPCFRHVCGATISGTAQMQVGLDQGVICLWGFDAV